VDSRRCTRLCAHILDGVRRQAATVLLRGAARRWEQLLHAWRPSAVLAPPSFSADESGLGTVLFRASRIPYAKSFLGESEAVLTVSLRDHAYAVTYCNGDGVPPTGGSADESATGHRRADHSELCGRYATATAAAADARDGGTPLLPFYIFDAPVSTRPAVVGNTSGDGLVCARGACTDDAPRSTGTLADLIATCPWSSVSASCPTRGGVPPRHSKLQPLYGNNSKPQLYLGGPGSGAPMHFHKDAWNVATSGLKRWYIVPPGCASYSSTPVAQWVVGSTGRGARRDALPALFAPNGGVLPTGCPDEDEGDDGGAHRPFECSQDAGDVLYIPAGFGHAVLNLETSMGAAVEFDTPLGKY